MSATLLTLLLPAAVGLALVAFGPRVDRVAAPFAAVISAATLVLALLGDRAERSYPFLLGQPWRLGSDGLSLTLAVTVCVVTACVLLAVPSQVEQRRGRLSGYLLLFLASVLLTLAARDLLSLLVGWELMGAASYVLIAHELGSARAAGSATTALLTTRAMDLGLYAAAGAALAGAGTLELAALPGLTGWPLHLAALGVLAAGLGKAAQLPVSFWLSRAMDGPSPVSALLHSAAMVAMGGYLLVRVSPLLAASGWADDAAAWTGGLTAILLGVVAVAQTDLKQLLAASTASQLGLVVLAAGIGATAAGGAHLVAHAAVKSLLFLAAGLGCTSSAPASCTGCALLPRALPSSACSRCSACWRWPACRRSPCGAARTPFSLPRRSTAPASTSWDCWPRHCPLRTPDAPWWCCWRHPVVGPRSWWVRRRGRRWCRSLLEPPCWRCLSSAPQAIASPV